MSTVIVIGYRPDLDQALRRRGLDPFYIAQEPAIPPKDRRFKRVIDIENVQEVLRAVLSAPIDDVVAALSVHEMGVFAAIYLRQQLNLPGNTDSKTALYFRDKYLQKSKLPPHIRRARCRYVSQDTSFADLADDLGNVFVVKPATGAGSLRTSIVRSPEEYSRALEPFPGHSDVQIVAESFIDAPEVYIDGVWENGDLRWSSMSNYHVSPLTAAQGGIMAAYLLDKRRHSTLFHESETLAGQVLSSLNAPDCVFHLEIFTTEAGLTFGECAIRIPGGLTPQMTQLTFGVDLFDVEISIALGEGASKELSKNRTPDRFHGCILLRPGKDGKLTQADFERNFVFDEIDYNSSPDAPIGPYGLVGKAIVSDQDELKLQKKIEDIVRFNETGST
ncbi:ATP-grasp domain-containing protein [Streptomyces sp. NBS 14/10]|uniref:ATP-grasp domain-containing protein n=1 Tax=Streptomyces sp. NBS 14/10 TaxID=1945643 RepID=UPI000B7F6F0D|nr:ATP-grasp domain-containing protein [Streptomyces sp. NBS 14/10]KAK1177533.1 ATP-grasp domain-containing protein [Streptomyces sp. NBS 14/10]NUS88369.1 ATP-grasp domain-containing protein [Streptomyces sp.]